MVYMRGHPQDYDRWAQAPGLEDWGYAHCLPYFKRVSLQTGEKMNGVVVTARLG
ncbi:MAG: hypothetical protein CM1200mP18_23070 [Gammaproteobacteria bacterium]|nr:MAG: hypothetical protein CM1200mP18_23070 [Gammaproteobacteria bacterium]